MPSPFASSPVWGDTTQSRATVGFDGLEGVHVHVTMFRPPDPWQLPGTTKSPAGTADWRHETVKALSVSSV